MDNPELILQSLEHFPKLLKDEEDYNIPLELEEYIHYVAKTGDPVFEWTLVKPLFREKIIKVIKDFFESNPGDIPDYPNVAKFNYDTMKETLLERVDWFKGAPFTIQRISELLVNPTKEYNRVDKYMRALEKNIYVVSTREPGMPTPVEESNSSFEESFIVNGNDFELKSDNNDDNGTKEDDEEESNASAMLMVKKCSEREDDDPNFNIEVDVTNTTTEDAPVDRLESGCGDISVHNEIPNTSEVLKSNEGKSGLTRKLDKENDEIENDYKRFKMDYESIDDTVKENEDSTEKSVDDINDTQLKEELPVDRSKSGNEKDTEDIEKESSNIVNLNTSVDAIHEANVEKEIVQEAAEDTISKISHVAEISNSEDTKVEETADTERIEDPGSTVVENPLSQESEKLSIPETSEELETNPTSNNDMLIETDTDKSVNEESSSTSDTETVKPKVDNEMELEETIDNKIESFDNKGESSLDMSEGDSMVISQDSGSSAEENVDKSIDKVENASSESSEMELGQIVNLFDHNTQ